MASTHDIQLEDLLSSYPPVTTPEFQTMLTAKREFSELAAYPGERLPPGRGHFFRHQLFTHRYLRAYDDLLITSATGTGKSLEVIGFFEYVRGEYEKAKIDPSTADEKVAHIKRFVILVKNKTLQAEIKNQIVCRGSAPGRYETVNVVNALKESSQKSAITNNLKRIGGYTVSTYKKFASLIERDYPNTEEGDAALIENYSDTGFWIDEAHNLILDPDDYGQRRDKQVIYNILYRVFHLVLRSKRIISTATPMINKASELVSLMNLILPLNYRLPPNYNYLQATERDVKVLFPDLTLELVRTPELLLTAQDKWPLLPSDQHDTARSFLQARNYLGLLGLYFRGQMPGPDRLDLSTADPYDLEPYFRGRIGFIRASLFNVDPVEQGTFYNQPNLYKNANFPSQLTLYQSVMSQKQSEAYLRAQGRSGPKTSKSRGGERDELYVNALQASNFVFPDGYWGKGLNEDERRALKETRAIRTKNRAELEKVTAGPSTPVLAAAFPVGGVIQGELNGQPVISEDDDENEIIGITRDRRAYRRYVNLEGDNFTLNREVAELVQVLNSALPPAQILAGIRELSCKYAEIIRFCLYEPGNCFVYNHQVEGSGLFVLGLCLEAMGFERYNETQSIFVSPNRTVKDYCAGGSEDATNRRVRADFQPKLRYCILTQRTSDTKFKSMMEAMNSYENRNGDYIKVFLSSRVGRDGINVNNVLQIHLIGSEWNPSGIYQALSRGIRATSHEDLLFFERKRISEEAGDPERARARRKQMVERAITISDSDEALVRSFTQEQLIARMTTFEQTNGRPMTSAEQQEVGDEIYIAVRADAIKYGYLLNGDETALLSTAINSPDTTRQLLLTLARRYHPMTPDQYRTIVRSVVLDRYPVTEREEVRARIIADFSGMMSPQQLAVVVEEAVRVIVRNDPPITPREQADLASIVYDTIYTTTKGVFEDSVRKYVATLMYNRVMTNNPEATEQVTTGTYEARYMPLYGYRAYFGMQLERDYYESRYLLSEAEKAQLIGEVDLEAPTFVGRIDPFQRHELVGAREGLIAVAALDQRNLEEMCVRAVFDLSPEEEAMVRYENADIAKAKIKINIYKHAAVALDGTSIDIYMYQRAEAKDRQIRRVMRTMKRCAIGCQVHRNRNILATDAGKDYTAECDYDTCDYQCIDPRPMEEDFSTYDVIYADGVIDMTENKIANILRTSNVITIEMIQRSFPDVRRKYIGMALERLISSKVALTDRFGYTAYLREDRDKFYLDRSYPDLTPAYSMRYYTDGLIGLRQRTLNAIAISLDSGENARIYHTLEQMDPTSVEFRLRLNGLGIEGKAMLLEEVVTRLGRGENTPFIMAVVERFGKYLYSIREPVTELRRRLTQMNQVGTKRGRRPNPGTKRKTKRIQAGNLNAGAVTIETETQPVYIHTLYTLIGESAGYATLARFYKAEGRLRFYNPAEFNAEGQQLGWRDLDEESELPVYNIFVQLDITNRLQRYEESGVYGIVLGDGRFMIRNRYDETAAATSDGRSVHRGKDCTSWKKEDLVRIMWYIGAVPPTPLDANQVPLNYALANRPGLIWELQQQSKGKLGGELNSWPNEQLEYFHRWFSMLGGMTIEQMCVTLQSRMREIDRVFDLSI